MRYPSCLPALADRCLDRGWTASTQYGYGCIACIYRSIVITARSDTRHRQILHGYATWHLLRRLRQRPAAASAGPQGSTDAPRHASRRQADNIRRHVLAAVTVLDLVQGRKLTLVALTQADLDRWVNDGQFTYPKETGHFIRWALARGHPRGLT